MNRKLTGELTSIVVILAGMAGCMSAKNHPALQSMQEAVKVQPFVEAYIEYLGPKDKWAGPASYLLHVSAKDGQMAQISMSPEWFNVPIKVDDKHLTTKNRAPASAIGMLKEFEKLLPQETRRGVALDVARAKIQSLAEVMQKSPDQPYQGCLNPVRVRLLRADGGMFEKTACRSDVGWTFSASEAVEYFMTAALYGVVSNTPEGADRAPASVTPAVAPTAAPPAAVPAAPAAPVAPATQAAPVSKS